MKRLIGALLAALVPFAGVLVAGSAASPAASAASPVASASTAGATSSWPGLEQTAMQVTAGYRGAGPLTAAGPVSSINSSTVTTASGRITVAQRTVVTTDGSGTVVLSLALLGGSQLVVNEMSPGADYRGETLVLRPGSSAIAGTYPLPGVSHSDVTTSSDRSGSGITATDAVLSTSRGRGRASARLDVGGCRGLPQAPELIGSTFGPLVQGEGIVTCATGESLSEIVSLYEGSTHVGATASDSESGNTLGVDSFDGCTVISGTHTFHTAELWSVNGTLQGGSTSAGSNLHCT